MIAAMRARAVVLTQSLVLAACLGTFAALAPTHAQSRRPEIEPPSPPRFLGLLRPPRYRIERLPLDIRQALREFPGEFSGLSVPALPGPAGIATRAAFLSLVRIDAPHGQRQFLFIGVSRSDYCGSAGCQMYLFERVGRRWNLIDEFVSAFGIELLGIWSDGYPTFLTSDSLVSGWLHWWENGRYEAACMPPTEGECEGANRSGMPHIFRDSIGQ